MAQLDLNKSNADMSPYFSVHANASAHENCASVRETCVRARGWGGVGVGVRVNVGVARAHIAQNDHASKLQCHGIDES